MREVEEELGLKPTDYTSHFMLAKIFNHPDKERRKFGIYYASFLKEKTSLIHINTNEIAGFDWFPHRELFASR